MYCALWTEIYVWLNLLNSLPHARSNVQVKDFIHHISGQSSLYGLQAETLASLVLSLLPPLTHSYEPLKKPSVMDKSLKEYSMMNNGPDMKMLLMQELLQNLHHCAGFCIPSVSSARQKALFFLNYKFSFSPTVLF